MTKTILNQCNTIFAMRTFDDTGKEFLSNYIGRDYAGVLPSLEARHAVVFGKASSCENPVLIRLTDVGGAQPPWLEISLFPLPSQLMCCDCIPMKRTSPRWQSTQMFNIFVSCLAFGLPLFLWQELYHRTDWAVLALVPLTTMVCIGSYQVILCRRRALLLAVLQANSWLTPILSGQIFSALAAVVITAATVPLLAYKALSAPMPELLVLAALSVAAVAFFQVFQAILQKHINDAFLPSASTWSSVALSGSIFLAIHVWAGLNYVRYPAYIKELSFSETMIRAMESLPERGGWIADILSIFYTMDDAKLWLVVRAGGTTVPAFIFTIYGALICFLVARAIVAVAAFYQIAVQGK